MARAAKVSARNAIEVVEAGYALDGDESAWLARVIDAALPDFTYGRGCYAFTCRIDRRGLAMGPTYLERALDPRFGEVVAQINREVPDGIPDVLVRSATTCGGVAEVLGPRHESVHHLRRYGAPSGIVDAFCLFAQDGEGFGLNLTAPSSALLHSHPRVQGIWRRVGAHLAAGLRLRRRIVEKRAQLDAVLAPSGALEHADGEVRESRSAREALIQSVRAMERARTGAERREPHRALELWRGLVAGEWSLVERFESDGRRYLVAYRNRPEVRDPRALTAHEAAVLRYATLGASNKEIAFTLGLSIGSVATAVSQLLRKLGARRRAELVQLAFPERADHLSLPLGDGAELAVLASPAGRDDLLARFTVAEREVARQILAGATTAEIARARRASPHTVANQVRAILRKAGVHSRPELVRALTA